MHFILNDIIANFDSATYSRGYDYAGKGMVRTDIAPRPQLWIGNLMQRDPASGKAAWGDYAVVSFSYDGDAVVADAPEIHRHTPSGFETVVRNGALEQAAAALAGLGFSGPAAPRGMWHLAHGDDWIAFAREQLPLLRAQGWDIDQDASFRFDLAEVEDWYADVAQSEQGGNAWFDLELGIVVNGARVALMPLLLQLIGSAPKEFDPAALEAHADHETLLAQLPGGLRVALPWGRIKPILRTPGELYFTEHAGPSLRLSVLDAARLAELETHARLRWAGASCASWARNCATSRACSRCRRRSACRRCCARTRATGWRGCNSCASAAWPASWPTTWDWGRRCRRWPSSPRTGTIADVQHIVILMQENRSFDHYFGTFRGVRGFGDRFPIPVPAPAGAERSVWFQRGEQPDLVVLFHLTTQRAAGTPHTWPDAQRAWNHGIFDAWPTHKYNHGSK